MGGATFSYFPGLRWLMGPNEDTMLALKRVADARGLRDVDELCVSLGKKKLDITHEEAFDLLGKECGREACMDVLHQIIYKAGKGYPDCNRLVNFYLKSFEEPRVSKELGKRYSEHLKKYCGYTREEIQLLK